METAIKCLIIFTCLSILGVGFAISMPDKKTLITQGKLYTNECKPIEINVNNGFFKSNTNKINCHGVLINVEKSKYDSAIDMYQRSKENPYSDKIKSATELW